MRAATQGPRKHRDVVIEREWRERVLRFQRELQQLEPEAVDED
jgi:hypothetical protein